MVQNEFIQELRGTWGPAPIEDPERHAIWERTMELELMLDVVEIKNA